VRGPDFGRCGRPKGAGCVQSKVVLGGGGGVGGFGGLRGALRPPQLFLDRAVGGWGAQVFGEVVRLVL